MPGRVLALAAKQWVRLVVAPAAQMSGSPLVLQDKPPSTPPPRPRPTPSPPSHAPPPSCRASILLAPAYHRRGDLARPRALAALPAGAGATCGKERLQKGSRRSRAKKGSGNVPPGDETPEPGYGLRPSVTPAASRSPASRWDRRRGRS
jgi:hypothetical protein